MTAVSCVAPEQSTPTQTPAVVPAQIPTEPTIVVPQSTVEMLSIGDGGLLSGKPCAAPCFFGITPGETSKDQVASLLQEQGFHGCSGYSINNVDCVERVKIIFTPSTGIVNLLGYILDRTISVQEIISKYGRPDSVHVIGSGIPEAPATTVVLYFDKINTDIRLPEVTGVNYPVASTTKIDLVTYQDNMGYAELKDSTFSQPWKGYGIYEPDLHP